MRVNYFLLLINIWVTNKLGRRIINQNNQQLKSNKDVLNNTINLLPFLSVPKNCMVSIKINVSKIRSFNLQLLKSIH